MVGVMLWLVMEFSALLATAKYINMFLMKSFFTLADTHCNGILYHTYKYIIMHLQLASKPMGVMSMVNKEGSYTHGFLFTAVLNIATNINLLLALAVIATM